MHPIDRELRDLWEACSPEHRNARDMHEMRNLRPSARSLATESQIDALQPWFSIQEVATDLLVAIHLSIYEDRQLPKEPTHKVPWALVGAAAGFGSSLLLSCAAGYDGPAKAQVRTYTEALLLLAAALHDPALGAAYFSANTDAKVVDFWHRNASPRKLHERIIRIEKQLGFSEDEISKLTDWRRREYEILSQSSHLSILGAMMTCLSAPTDDPSLLRFRLFGGTTMNSRRTLSYAATSTWHCLRLIRSILFPPGSGDPLHLLPPPAVRLSLDVAARIFILETVVPRYMQIDSRSASDA